MDLKSLQKPFKEQYRADADGTQLDKLREKTEQYCVVLQTLARPPAIESRWDSHK